MAHPRLSFLLALVPGLALLGACGPKEMSDADAIQALVAKEVVAMNKKDFNTLSEVWAHDRGVLLFDVQPPGRFQGWDEVGGTFRDFLARFSEIHLSVSALRIEARGAVGYATYDWSLTGRMGDYAVDDRGQATAIYRKAGDGWKLVHAHYSSIPAATGSGAPPVAGHTPAGPAPAGPGLPGPTPRPSASPAATPPR
jgi:ketosteroid isomerase-like protein